LFKRITFEIARREHTMNKGELIDKIAKDAKISKVQAAMPSIPRSTELRRR